MIIINSNYQKNLIIFISMGLLLTYNLVFFVYPLGFSFFASFNDWNPLAKGMKFIGLENYARMFTSEIVLKSLINTVIFTLSVVVLRTALSLTIANAMIRIKHFKSLFRSLYFLPVVMPLVAVSIVWKWVYHPRLGLFNSVLSIFGVKGVAWLTNIDTAMPAIVLMTIWKDLGYAIVIFIAALLSVPADVYEAADLDGCTETQKFFKITVPLVRPTTVFIVITSIISNFQHFVQFMVMTKGGPVGSTKVLSYLIFEEAFEGKRFGYASALSMLLLLIVMTITYFQLYLSKRGDV